MPKHTDTDADARLRAINAELLHACEQAYQFANAIYWANVGYAAEAGSIAELLQNVIAKAKGESDA